MSSKIRRAVLHALQQNYSALPRAMSECTRCGMVQLTQVEDPEFMCDTCAEYVAK